MSVLLTFCALIFERFVGYPQRLVDAIGHPVMWIGALIARLDREWNKETDPPDLRRRRGFEALLVIVLAAVVPALILHWALGWHLIGLLLLAVLASSLIAQKSLEAHVAAVAAALETDGLDGGRKAVSMIVGRDPETLDEAGVSRAAIESLAENFSDGVVAPAFWMVAAGLPGAAAYKAINTADSMIGHRTPRHARFGFAAARLDDLVNLPASRLTGLLLVVAAILMPGANPAAGWAAIWRDAHRHRSPNAGWPEAAMAGALGLALAGPRVYGGDVVDDALMGEGGRREATAADIRRALRLFRIADWLLIALIGGLALYVISHWR
ncbi:cobalamin biosynthesis protein CobD [Chelativorans sp. ZYF759]|uniref:adenosylcobinamide-phosphate synthase CbiB n=1 Tax=Chelativorans sp. ZYF759 TaxID=2692213 RepID=UPI00145EA365|nr:adenosylcobinamide-phosphate synthase CbiB [Chelativorans sp. ZYF759]NMG38463.1 cobalamin biosynthesis protein CobD [Chelativorans sp. ZYF759]